MDRQDIERLVAGTRNEVWTILMKSGLELITQLTMDSSPIIGAEMSYTPSKILLYRPLKVTPASLPMQGHQRVQINNIPQMLPLAWFWKDRDMKIQIEPADIWAMIPAPKEFADEYSERVSGIARP
jgi:hypothetical protein